MDFGLKLKAPAIENVLFDYIYDDHTVLLQSTHHI